VRLIDNARISGAKIPEVPVIVVDNVAEYMASIDDGKKRRTVDLPCGKPPFDELWIESKKPDAPQWQGNVEMFGYFIERRDDLLDRVRPEIKAKGATEVYSFSMYAQASGAVLRVEKGDAAIGLKDGGEIAWCVNSPKLPDEEAHPFQWMHHCACLAISFMHCRNIVTSDVVTPASARQSKKGKKRIRCYSVLQIDPMRDVLRREGEVEKNGLTRALHICRGHFKRYDKPLFGRTFTGTVWVPAHARGSADKGVVEKSYAVETPPTPKGQA
jgi:hypothetical protein